VWAADGQAPCAKEGLKRFCGCLSRGFPLLGSTEQCSRFETLMLNLQAFSMLEKQTQRRGSAFIRGRGQGMEMKLRKGRLCRLKVPKDFSSNFSPAPSVSARADDLIDWLSRNTKRHARHRDWPLRLLRMGFQGAYMQIFRYFTGMQGLR